MESHFEEALHQSPALILMLDADFTCCGLSTAWRERTHLSSEQELDISLAQLIDLDSNSVLETQLEHVIDQDTQVVEARVDLKMPEGPVPATISAWRTFDTDTGKPCLLLVATDINRIADASEELVQLRTHYQLILDSAGEGIYGLDSDGLITFSNAAAEAILGWKGEDVSGKSAHEVHHHSHADGSIYPREQCPIYAALTDGEIHRVENEVFWHRDGSSIPVEYTSTPMMRAGEPIGAVVVFRDVSDRKEIERQRESAYEEIQQLKEKLELERDYLRDEVNTAGNFGEIIGESEALKRTLSQVEAVARTPASVLILGESGVGKEMIARAIHCQSDRADKPMVKVNCASIPTELFESEFFGHVKGSFTGAHQDRIGRLQLADGGTLFLDEVGEIPLAQQGKLLRALQENEFERVGDDKTMQVNVRVVAATNRDLAKEIKAGRFREDLFYRLSVFPIEVPPLRDRISDVVPIAISFLEKACRELGRDPMKFSQSHISLLKNHSWPGNIRELKNTIDRAVISSTGKKLRLDLALVSVPVEESGTTELPSAEASTYLTSTEFKALEKANITAALQHANWRTWGDQGAAALLGVKPSTLAYQMKTLGIRKPVSTD